MRTWVKWGVAGVVGVVGIGGVRAQQSGEDHTIIQTGTPYSAKSNLQVDLALVANDESERSLGETKAKVQSWRERGYRVYGFASVARVYDFYMKGGWRDLQGRVDGGGHDGEVQRDRFGGKFGPHEFMMMPSLPLIEHKKLWAQSFIEAGASGMAFEEPDLFMDGGYDDQFKKEWQAYYKQPWQAPHSSIAARWQSERLKAYLGYRSYRELSRFSKARGGNDFHFMLATHSLPNYMLWGISFNYYQTFSLPTVDSIQAQIWTGTAKTPVLFEGKVQERLFDNSFVDYSYSANLAEALQKKVSFNLDPYEDEAGLPFEFYKKGFEHTLAASLMFPRVNRWEILPWPDRIYANDRIPPLYGTELQNVLTAMTEVGPTTTHRWSGTFPRTGILFSESALYEMRDPQPSNPQSLFALTLPFVSQGIPVDVVPLEATVKQAYLDRFRVLFVSYDFYKPLTPDVHTALAGWVKRGGMLVVLGGHNAYNAAPMWWREAGWDSPTAHLLAQLGLGDKATRMLPQRPGDIRYVPAGKQDAPYAMRLAGFFSGLHGADFRPRSVSFVPNGQYPDTNYLDTQVGPGNSLSDLRFADGKGYFTYKFRTQDLKALNVRLDISNTFTIEASTDNTHWTLLLNSLDESGGKSIHDGSNRRERSLNLTPFLSGSMVYLRFRDPSTEDGWGPALRKVTVQPVYKRPISLPPAPLNLRDSYAVAYTGIKGQSQTLVRGASGLPIAFTAKAGKGEVLVVGAPPAVFGSSVAKTRTLQALYQDICQRHRLPLRPDGGLHLTRGNYQIVYPSSRAVQLKGRFLDVLSPDLPLLDSPRLAVGTPRLLLSVDAALRKTGPTLLFASHRVRDVAANATQLTFTVEGPERIPAACRLAPGTLSSPSVTCRRVRDNQAVTPETRRAPDGTLYVRFPNEEGGVRVSFGS